MTTKPRPFTKEHWVNFKVTYDCFIRSRIQRNLREGTAVAMGADNLFAISAVPPNAPQGANARWALRQIFNDIIRDLPQGWKQYILPQ